MSEQAGKTAEPTTTDTEHFRRKEGRDAVVSFADNRPATAAQRRLQESADSSPSNRKLQAFQLMADNTKKPAPLKTRTFPAAAIAQRVLVPFKQNAMPSANGRLVMNDAATIEGLTNTAYVNTWNRLSNMGTVPLDRTQFPGVTAGHFAHFINVLGSGTNEMKAAAAGYVIEDQVSFNPSLPDSAKTQVVLGNARLDFVIKRGDSPNISKGIVDITSSGQQGHVLNKRFNKTPYKYIAESTYQSIDFTALHGGAPLLTTSASTLAKKAMHRRANTFINGRLGALNRILEMQSEGVMAGDDTFEARATDAKRAINNLPKKGKWTTRQVAGVDNAILRVNILLSAARQVPLPTLKILIAEAKEKYFVNGRPRW